MFPAQPNAVLRHLRRVAGLDPGHDLTDAALLARYVGGRDEQAFAALVHRYGRLVRSVCRRVLHHPQDADDAFQATFLVFAARAPSIRKATSVSSWLYGAAYRTAMNAKRQRTRRREEQGAPDARGREQPVTEAALRELQVILDQEVSALPEKYRAPFVLCCLDGRSKAEAARELGWKEGTVSGRLARAREELRQRLLRRGVVLSAALAVLGLGGAAEAAVPPPLVKGTVAAALAFGAGKTAVAGRVSAEVVALAKGALRNMGSTKPKVVTALLVALGCLAGARLLSLQALAGGREPAAPQTTPEASQESPALRAAAPKGDDKEAVAVSGRVLDPDGKPVAGARLQGRHEGPQAVSDADGRFRLLVPAAAFPTQVVAAADGFGVGWLQVANAQGAADLTLKLVPDVPIAGHVIDPEGRPVAGATIHVVGMWAMPGEDLSPWLKTVAKRKANSLYDGDYFKTTLWVPGLPEAVTTDKAGRFRLAGVGRERVLIVTIGAPKYQADMIGIMTRPAEKFQVTDEWKLTANVYGARFDHVLAPSRVLMGTVRDLDTGKPTAGVHVMPEGASDFHTPDARTDKDGTYRIDSLPSYYSQQRHPNIPGPVLLALAPRNEPYLRSIQGIQVDGPRGQPVVLDLTLKRGIWVTVKVTNKATGKPVAGAHVEYYPFRNNPRTAGLTEMSFGWMPHLQPHRTGADGIGRVPALPGPGLLGAGVDDSNAFLHMEPLTYEEAANVFSGIFRGGDMHNALQGIVRINPEETKPTTYEIGLESGATLACAVVGPDGKPVTGCRVYGALSHTWPPWSKEPLAGSEFAVRQLAPGRRAGRPDVVNAMPGDQSAKPRTVIVLHPEKNLVRLLELKGDEKGPLTVKLGPAATLTGRLLDPDGKPMPRTSMSVDFELHNSGGLNPSFPAQVTTDAEGRFRVEGLVAGPRYYILVGGPPKFVGEVKRLTVRPGETRDLGEVKYEPLPQ
jgi:RNA polymerase sigma factor (sigma-70 family)